MQNKVGACVENDNFYGRTKELKQAWRRLEDGNSLVLAAPRRVGKTSFAKKMASIASEKGWSSIYVDLEGVHNEREFVEAIVDKMGECKNLLPRITDKVVSLISQMKANVKIQDVEVNLERQRIKESLFKEVHSLFYNLKSEKVLLICDELAVFLNYILNDSHDNRGIDNVEYFLNLLRSLRQIDDCEHRWIFCSSVSIENFLKRHNLSKTMNDVDSFRIDALNEHEAKGLMRSLRESYNISIEDESINYLLEKIGLTLPYYIQLMFSEIYDIKIDDEKEPVSVEDIDKAYEMLLSKQYFNTWTERLADYSEEQDLRLILIKIAEAKDGGCSRNILRSLFIDREMSDEYLSELLMLLGNDGYIILDKTDKYVFRSFLLRDFWYNKYIA